VIRVALRDRRRSGGVLAVAASDTQFCLVGPEKGVIHLALAAIVNAVWDLYEGRREAGVNFADMSPAIWSVHDHITDALTSDEWSSG
jgi:L-fuconate dehydratase